MTRKSLLLFTATSVIWGSSFLSEVPDRRRTLGLVIGFIGVIALLSIDFRGDATELLAATAVILSALS